MKVFEILRQKGGTVWMIEEDKTVEEAAAKLDEHGIGALIVTGPHGGVTGIISERDILRLVGRHCGAAAAGRPAEAGSPCHARVGDVMTKSLIIGVPDDEVDYVMGIMTKNRLRHLPILDGGTLVGLVSIGDVVNAQLTGKAHEIRTLKDHIALLES